LKNLLNTLQSLNEDELIQQQQYLPTTARKMLAKGMDEASIMDMTGLTAEKIK